MTTRRRFLGAATAAVALPSPSFADTFPSRPIRIVVPYAAGGVTDIISRIVSQSLTEDFGLQTLVDNRPGASGILGTALVAKAPADGYTMLMGAISPLVIAKIAVSKLPYDPLTDFTPLTQVATTPVALVVHPSVGASSVKELVDLLRAKPGSFNYSSAGAGTPSHLACELFRHKLGVQMTHVPYKGTGASLADLVAGHVQLTIDSLAGLLPFIKSDKLRPLAVASPTRSALLPDVPTLQEAGFPGINISGWYGYLVPAKTPDEIAARLRSALTDAIRAPKTRAKLNELGAIPRTGGSQDFLDLMRSEYTLWSPIVKSLDLQFS